MGTESLTRISSRREMWRWLKYLLVPMGLLAGLAVTWPTWHARYLAREIEARGGYSGTSSRDEEWVSIGSKESWLKRWPRDVSAFLTDRLDFCDLDGASADADFIRSVCATGTLTALVLDHGSLDDSTGPLIASNRELTFLSLGHTAITGATLGHLRELSKLTILYLGGTAIRDDDLHLLANLTALEGLSLSETPITVRGLRHLTALSKLSGLDLRGTAVDDDAMRIVAEFPSLVYLDIEACPVTDVGLAFLTRRSSLYDISLGDTPITSKGLRTLTQLQTLRELKISQRQIPLLMDVNFSDFDYRIRVYVNGNRSDLNVADAELVRQLDEARAIDLTFVDDPTF